MRTQDHVPPDADETGGSAVTSYQPPKLTFVGSLSELVAGSQSGDRPDGIDDFIWFG